jgi:hypothetical protein
MKTTSKLILVVIASSTLLFGCSAPRHGAHWEYKTATVSNMAADAKLNELAEDGWSVVAFSRNEGGSNESTFVLKRKKYEASVLTREPQPVATVT